MTFSTWQSVNVDEWDSDETEEQLGTKEKYWVRDPNGESWLFKYIRVRHGDPRGEDWAEWLAQQLGDLIGVPTVQIRPAFRGAQRGILSRSVVPPGCRLELGNELLRRGAAFCCWTHGSPAGTGITRTGRPSPVTNNVGCIRLMITETASDSRRPTPNGWLAWNIRPSW